jgi:uncharacterized membrane protein YraQ (UPF0718 family)
MNSASPPRLEHPKPALGLIVFLAVAVIGLFQVKWFPYYNRAFTAASTHSIGNSILMGTSAAPPAPSLQAAIDYALAYGKAIWQAMVLGLLLGSAVQALLPTRWIARALGGHGFGSVVTGGLMALPGMMCTCCAAPVVAGLRRCQASPGGALAFWLGNSVLNPATLVFMGFVLGWQWAGLRLVLGVLMVFGLGYLLNRMVRDGEPAQRPPITVVREPEEQAPAYWRDALARWARILATMTVRLVPEYIVLVLLLGAARAWLFPQVGPAIGNEIAWILAFAVAGAIFVIPTAGEVPIIQAMLALGLAAGPAAALLMTLPPISLPSLAMLFKSFSARQLSVVFVGVVAFGVLAAGLAVLLRF